MLKHHNNFWTTGSLTCFFACSEKPDLWIFFFPCSVGICANAASVAFNTVVEIPTDCSFILKMV